MNLHIKKIDELTAITLEDGVDSFTTRINTKLATVEELHEGIAFCKERMESKIAKRKEEVFKPIAVPSKEEIDMWVRYMVEHVSRKLAGKRVFELKNIEGFCISDIIQFCRWDMSNYLGQMHLHRKRTT